MSDTYQHSMKKIISLITLFLLAASLQAQSYIPVKNDSRYKVKPVVPIKAYGFDLRDVQLKEGSPFYHAMQQDAVPGTGIAPGHCGGSTRAGAS